MILSDVSVRRPVFAAVLSLLLIAFGLVALQRLPLREYPDIDPPVVSIDTRYPGAAANVVDTRITAVIEDRIAGIEGISHIESSSTDGRSRITVEFVTGRDIDSATNDIRDRVSGVADNLPAEAEVPEVSKDDSNDDVILWLNLVSDRMTVPELTDYANRYLVDRFSVLDGVARVRVGGGKVYAMRIWLDRSAMAARRLTAADVETALRAENVELPAGSIESVDRQFTVRLRRAFRQPEDFAALAIARGEGGYLVRLGDIARVELGSVEDRSLFRGNGIPMVGIGVIKQSTANILSVAQAAKVEMRRINPTLPEGLEIRESYDSSVFVEGAIEEVARTLAIAIGLVVLVIYLFLGSLRATIVPAVTVPVSLVATFVVLYALGFTINLLTLLALVLAIGLVVDDAIVVLENIHRRMHSLGETRLVAAFRGSRQIAFAVVATTLVLVAVFVPIAFLQGDIGRLFSEFALTMSAAVVFSSVLALSLAPMLASKVLAPPAREGWVTRVVESAFATVQRGYGWLLGGLLAARWLVLAGFIALAWWSWGLYTQLPQEYAPREDRGAFFVLVSGPEGATYRYMEDYMNEVESRLLRHVDSGEVNRLLVRSPRGFGAGASFNTGIVIIGLAPWGQRRSGWAIMDEVRKELADLPGVRAFPVMRQGFGARVAKPVQFVIGGGSYEELVEWRDTLLERIEQDNPGLLGVDSDYKETKPQLQVVIDYDRAADLGITVSNIGRTLETMLGSRQVTTYIEGGEEYDVILEGNRAEQRTPASLENIYVRSGRTGELLPLSAVVSLEEIADATSLNRYNRLRAITIEANLAEGYALADALDYLERTAREVLPATVRIDYKGQSADFKEAGGSVLFIMVLGTVVVFLVLAAQFESWIHPLVIMLTVPMAMAGAMLGLKLSGMSVNLYSQIGFIMLVGLAAKNGILIVEFANQLRDDGMAFREALMEASRVRLRPIVMTGVTTIAGSIPLLLSSGPGAETRAVIGTVVMWGVGAATLFTLVVVPVAYDLIARGTGSPGDVTRRLQAEMARTPDADGPDDAAAR